MNKLFFCAVLLILAAGCETSSEQRVAAYKAELQSSLDKIDADRKSEALAKEQREQQARESYFNSHPDMDKDTKDAILKKQVRVGMTSEQCRLSWGSPYYGVNKTVTGSHVFEQWVYSIDGNSYLYFDDGILTSLTTSGH